MRLQFDPTTGADDDAAAAAKRQLVAGFGSWLQGRSSEDAEAADVELLLDWKYAYGDGDFGSWTRADVDEVLLEHLPRKLTAATEHIVSIPASLGAFVHYLDDAGLLRDGSDDPDAVATRALSQRQAFLEAMEDRRNWGMAKRLMSSAGFGADDVPDQAALETAMSQFNALSFEERGRVLGLESADGLIDDDDDEPITLPFRLLPLEEELLAAAVHVPLLREVDALHAEVGLHGVALREAQDRSAAVLKVALAAGAVEDDGSLVRAAAAWDELDPPARWALVTEAVFDVGVASLASPSPTTGDTTWIDVADDIAIELVAVLWIPRTPISVDLLADTLHGMATKIAPDGAPPSRSAQRHVAAARVTEMLDTLAAVGIVRRSGDEIELLPAGARLVASLLEDVGAEVLYPEAVVEFTAGELLDAMVDRDDDAELLATCWAPPADRHRRAVELVNELAVTNEPDRLLHGIAILQRFGDAAIEPLRDALDTPFAPQAWLLLADAGAVPIEDVPVEMVIDAGVAAMIGLAHAGTPADVVESMLGNLPAAEHTQFIERLATSPHPRTAELLDLIGRHHPDRATAKHARKCAHRWRSHHAVPRS